MHPISALQSEWSLWERTIETDVLATARAARLVPFSPLGRGFLTGPAKRAEEYSADDHRHREPRLQGENYDANLRILAAVEAIAAGRGVTPAQLAVAWLLHQGGDVVPIPGTKRRSYLEKNIAAASIALRAEELAALNAAASIGGTAGPRYGAEMMALIDR